MTHDHQPLHDTDFDELAPGEERTIELREEELVANRQLRELGEVNVRTVAEEVPAQLEVEALREEVVIEHEAVGQVVNERQQPWEQDGEMILPIYEEQLVVSKRLVLRERLHVRRINTRERQLFQDTVRRERLVVEDPQQTGRVHETYPTDTHQDPRTHTDQRTERTGRTEPTDGNVLRRLVSRALE